MKILAVLVILFQNGAYVESTLDPPTFASTVPECHEQLKTIHSKVNWPAVAEIARSHGTEVAKVTGECRDAAPGEPT